MEGVPDHKPPRPSAQRCPRIPPQGEGALQAHRYELRDEGHFEWGHHVIWWSSSTPPENPVHESKVSAGGPDAGHRHLVARRSPERLCREGRSQHDTPHLRGPETLRGVESCHRHEEAQPTPAGPAVQASIHRRCSSPSPTQRLCHQDRPDGRLPSHRVQRGSAEVVRIRVEGSEVPVRSASLREPHEPVVAHACLEPNHPLSPPPGDQHRRVRGRHADPGRLGCQSEDGHSCNGQSAHRVGVAHQLRQKRPRAPTEDRVPGLHTRPFRMAGDRPPSVEAAPDCSRAQQGVQIPARPPEDLGQSRGPGDFGFESGASSSYLCQAGSHRDSVSGEQGRILDHHDIVTKGQRGSRNPGGVGETSQATPIHPTPDSGGSHGCVPAGDGSGPDESIEPASPRGYRVLVDESRKPRAHQRPGTPSGIPRTQEMGPNASEPGGVAQNGQHGSSFVCAQGHREGSGTEEAGEADRAPGATPQHHPGTVLHPVHRECSRRQGIPPGLPLDPATDRRCIGHHGPGGEAMALHLRRVTGDPSDPGIEGGADHPDMEISSVVAAPEERSARDGPHASTTHEHRTSCVCCQIRRHGTLELLFQEVLKVPDSHRALILPDRTARAMRPAYNRVRCHLLQSPQHQNVFSPAFTVAVLDAPTSLSPRPESVTSPFRRMMNWLWDLFTEPKSLSSKIFKEMTKERSTRPPRRAKATVNIKLLIERVAAPPPSSYLALRNKAILLYIVASGRRPHNASVARAPSASNIFGKKAICFTEFRAKNDGSRVGNFNFIPAASCEEIDPVHTFLQLFGCLEYQSLLADFIALTPLVDREMVPLFLYRVGRGPSKGSVRPLSADAISNVVSKWFEVAGVDKDARGNTVYPKFLRNTQSARMKIAQVPDVIRKLTCAWALTDVSDAFYFSDDGRPSQLTDFLLGLSDNPGISLGMSPESALASWLTPEICAMHPDAPLPSHEPNPVVRSSIEALVPKFRTGGRNLGT